MTKNWDKGYNELLYMTNLPSLPDRRLYLKLCSLYKIVHNLSHQIFLYLKSPDRIPAHLLPCATLLHILCFFNSFVPHAVSQWNSLPEPVVSAPSLATFQHTLTMYYTK